MATSSFRDLLQTFIILCSKEPLIKPSLLGLRDVFVQSSGICGLGALNKWQMIPPPEGLLRS